MGKNTPEYAAAYYIAHREEAIVRAATWYAANRARVAARAASDPWRKAKQALHRSRATARRYGLDVGTLTKEVFARLHLLPCTYCGVMPAMGADHVMPMGRGGPNTLENLTPACLPCNHRKHAKVSYAG